MPLRSPGGPPTFIRRPSLGGGGRGVVECLVWGQGGPEQDSAIGVTFQPAVPAVLSTDPSPQASTLVDSRAGCTREGVSRLQALPGH